MKHHFISSDLIYDLSKKLWHILYPSNSVPVWDNMSDIPKDLSNKKIIMPASLLPVFQSGIMAFQMMTHLQNDWDTNLKNTFHQFFLSHPQQIQAVPDSDFIPQCHIHDDILSQMMPVKMDTPPHDSWTMLLKKIMHTPLGGLWSLQIPFIANALISGLCPVSFYYHYMILPDKQKTVDFAMQILNLPCQTTKNDSLSPVTGLIFNKNNQKVQDYLHYSLKISCVSL